MENREMFKNSESFWKQGNLFAGTLGSDENSWKPKLFTLFWAVNYKWAVINFKNHSEFVWGEAMGSCSYF